MDLSISVRKAISTLFAFTTLWISACSKENDITEINRHEKDWKSDTSLDEPIVDSSSVVTNATKDQDIKFTSVSAGDWHTCGIRKRDGNIQCWGANNRGQSEPPVGVAFSYVSAGEDDTCGVREVDGHILCWGDDFNHELNPPDDVAFTEVSLGVIHTCGLRAVDGTVQCWGSDGYGAASPPTNTIFSSVSAAYGHTCGIRKSDGHCPGYLPDPPRKSRKIEASIMNDITGLRLLQSHDKYSGC